MNHSKMKFRIYSGKTKTSFCDIFFTWKASFGINFHLSSVCSALTKYVLSKWDYRKEKSIVTIEDGDLLIKKLNLKDLTKNWSAALRRRDDQKRLLLLKDIAEMMEISRSTVYRYLAK